MRYEPNRSGVQELLNSADVQAFVLDRAELGAEEARSRAPVSSETDKRHYVDSITVYADRAGDRVAAVVTATAPYAQRVEQRHHVIAAVVDRIERG